MDKDKKTLVILSPGFPANEQDSTCIPSRQLFVKALKENSSLNIIVLAFQYPFEKKTYDWHGVKIFAFNGRNIGKLRRIRIWLKVWATLIKIKQEYTVVGILSFWLGECALLGSSFGKKNKIKHFTWILGQDAKKGNKYARLIKPLPSNLIALSDFIADEFFKNYAIKPRHTIPVGIDTSLFGSGFPTRDIDIMGAGSLIPLKRYELFVEVISELAHHFPGINAVICGAGSEREKLLSLIAAYNLQQNITLAGEIHHKEILAMMQRSKIFLHTSSYEGYGTVQAEALYGGCYLISFCKPMKTYLQREYYVQTKKEAADTAKTILELQPREHIPVLCYKVKDIAMQVEGLFS